ncbi:MAG TPA: chromosomal replication initiator protein DnaA [Planctomycetota bacterium]|nr:chromosomal replication initiator protein DnaA [Planctomycetota bacterium]
MLDRTSDGHDVARSAQTLEQAWQAMLERMRTPENEQGVRLWLASPKVRPVGVDEGIFTIECPTALFQHTIRDRYADPLAVVASEVLGQPVTEVRCRVSGAALREHEARVQGDRSAPERDDKTTDRAGERHAPRGGRWGHGFKLLTDFVVGHTNRLAYDAITRILEDPTNPVNPLFIHGASGLGKTHLEQGLALAFHERYPKSKVQYIRCEQFTNDYIAACEQGSPGIQAFRVKMRHPDLLLIDDIHFLSRGQMIKTKEELFSTFNQLNEQGKKVVITSDAPPADIKYLEERFIQRFSGGLVIALEKPDPKLRREVVGAKAKAQGITLADEVMGYVVDHITDNIREIEGAVNKLAAYSQSFQRRIDLALARQALGDLIDRSSGEPRAKMIMREVADYFELTVDDLVGRNRSGARATARHVAMYVLKSASADTYAAIGQAFGVKSHSSVAYACEQVAKYRAQDTALDGFIIDLLMRVKRV